MTAKPEERPPLNILLNQLEWNLDWLQQMGKNEPTDYFRDALLQRFEFTFTTAIKCIQSAALRSDAPGESPRECFQLAERMEWFPAGDLWQDMVRDYENMKQGNYQESAAVVFPQFEQYREGLKFLYDQLSALPPKS